MFKKHKKILGLIVLLVICFSVLGSSPNIAFAANSTNSIGSGAIDDIVADDGTIKISGQDGIQTGIKKGKLLVNVVMIFALIAVVILLIVAWVKVAAAQGKGQSRGEAIGSVLWVLVSAAGIGGTGIIFAVAYNFFRG